LRDVHGNVASLQCAPEILRMSSHGVTPTLAHSVLFERDMAAELDVI
jgi:hypothetical protein